MVCANASTVSSYDYHYNAYSTDFRIKPMEGLYRLLPIIMKKFWQSDFI